MTSTVAIILINWNDYKHTSACLNSLAKLLYKSYKVYVVDNDSRDDSLQKLKNEFQKVAFIENDKNLGFTGGNNAGIRQAMADGCEHILLLNNDTIVEPNFLNYLVDQLDNDPSIGAVQPKIMFNKDRTLIWSAGGSFKPLFTLAPTIGHAKRDNTKYNTVSEMDWISCCAFMVRSDVLRKIGFEDEIFFYGCYDDVDLSFRVRKAGYKLYYCPQSVIYHDVMSAVLSDDRKDGNIKPFFHYLVTRNHWFFIRKHTRILYLPSSIIYQIGKLLSYGGVFLIKGRFLKLRAFIHGFLHGIIQPLVPERLNHLKFIQKYK